MSNNAKKLNTGWTYWDKYLSHLVGEKINCLDIGSFEGASTCWMLDNLCTNSYSRVFSIDTWQGGPDYSGSIDFSKIEETFDNNVKKTGKKSQHVKLKMTSSEGLVKLRQEKYVFFDFIFIDASHEAKDVLSDAILSWELLSEGGILIFDDYQWDKLNKDYFCPKVAVDSFNYIYKPQLDILYVGYQCIVKKKIKCEFEKPQFAELYKLINDVEYFKFYQFDLSFDDNISGDKLEYDLKMNNLPSEYELDNTPYSELNFMSKSIGFFIEKKFKNYEQIEIYNFFHLFNIKNPFDIINTTITRKIKHKIDNEKLFKNVKYFNLFIKDNSLAPVVNYISQNCGKSICLFLRHEFDIDNFKKEIEKLFKCDIKNMTVFTISNEMKKNTYNIKMENYDDLKNIIKTNANTKYDFLFLRFMMKKNTIRKSILKKENLLGIELLCRIFLSLSLQKINGKCVLSISIFITDVFFDIVMILKKYYAKLKFTNITNEKNYGIGIIIECENFLGIQTDELYNLEKIIIKISNEIKNFTNYEKSSKIDLKSLFALNSNQKNILDKFKLNFINHIDLIMESATIYYTLLENIKNYISDNKTKSNNKNYLLENIIYKKQISEFVYSLNYILNDKK